MAMRKGMHTPQTPPRIARGKGKTGTPRGGAKFISPARDAMRTSRGRKR